MNTENFVEQLLDDHDAGLSVMDHTRISVMAVVGVLCSVSKNTGDPIFKKIADDLRKTFIDKTNEI